MNRNKRLGTTVAVALLVPSALKDPIGASRGAGGSRTATGTGPFEAASEADVCTVSAATARSGAAYGGGVVNCKAYDAKRTTQSVRRKAYDAKRMTQSV